MLTWWYTNTMKYFCGFIFFIRSFTKCSCPLPLLLLSRCVYIFANAVLWVWWVCPGKWRMSHHGKFIIVFQLTFEACNVVITRILQKWLQAKKNSVFCTNPSVQSILSWYYFFSVIDGPTTPPSLLYVAGWPQQSSIPWGKMRLVNFTTSRP